MSDKTQPAELEYLNTQPVMKLRNNWPTVELCATGVFRDKAGSGCGSFLVQITAHVGSGIDPQHFVAVVQRVLDELKGKIIPVNSGQTNT